MKKIRQLYVILCIRVANLDPDSIGSEEPDPDPTSVSGSRKSKIWIYSLEDWMLLIELEETEILGLRFSKWTLDPCFIERWCYKLVLEFKNC
jgi:hypothetical protein